MKIAGLPANCFVVNCKGATFGDMIIVPQDADFVLIVQEKQGEIAKKQQYNDKTVPTRKLQSVKEEHGKCRIQTSHLFIMFTDEDFTDQGSFADNEIVIPYSKHASVMGPQFNHSNKARTSF
jgi:hypothetical protein